MTGDRVHNAKPSVRAALLAVLSAALIAGCATQAATTTDAQFAAFLDRADAAQLEFQQGRPGSYQALWSTRADVTLAGGFGGDFERGWERVSQRLAWASAQFRQGRNTIRRIASGVSGDLGYLVQTEQLVFRTPDSDAIVERSYRVTMLFRREAGEWRIIHRHADTQNVKAAPK